MADTSARLLKLLSLLQARRDWPGTELAERLAITPRTVRRDVERLRALGYPVHATQGTAGYQLGAGASLPPLLLDDEEAVAVAVALRTASSSSVSGIEDTARRALAKLEQILPARLRHRVNGLQTAMVRGGSSGPTITSDVLVALADACRRQERLRLDYTSALGVATVRTVEPHSLVNFGANWYLVAWDTDREDWRTFRVDRLSPRTPTGPRFPPRDPPDGGAAAYVAHQLSSRAWPLRATVELRESAESVRDRVWPGMGVIQPVDEESCLLHIGADSLSALVWMITSVDADFTLRDGPPGLAEAFRTQAERCRSAVDGW